MGVSQNPICPWGFLKISNVHGGFSKSQMSVGISQNPRCPWGFLKIPNRRYIAVPEDVGAFLGVCELPVKRIAEARGRAGGTAGRSSPAAAAPRWGCSEELGRLQVEEGPYCVRRGPGAGTWMGEKRKTRRVGQSRWEWRGARWGPCDPPVSGQQGSARRCCSRGGGWFQSGPISDAFPRAAERTSQGLNRAVV